MASQPAGIAVPSLLGGGLFRQDIHRIAEQLDLAQQIDEIDPPSD